jgi:hypothetical protein
VRTLLLGLTGMRPVGSRSLRRCNAVLRLRARRQFESELRVPMSRPWITVASEQLGATVKSRTGTEPMLKPFPRLDWSNLSGLMYQLPPLV